MIVYLIAMLVVLVVAAGIAGLVLVGIEGRRLERYPRLAQFLVHAAQHLNGEPDAPTRTGTSARPDPAAAAGASREHQHV